MQCEREGGKGQDRQNVDDAVRLAESQRKQYSGDAEPGSRSHRENGFVGNAGGESALAGANALCQQDLSCVIGHGARDVASRPGQEKEAQKLAGGRPIPAEEPDDAGPDQAESDNSQRERQEARQDQQEIQVSQANE